MDKFPSQTQDKFTVRFPDGLRDAIAERAKANGRSMNSEIIYILQKQIDEDSIKSLPPTSESDVELTEDQMRSWEDNLEIARKALANVAKVLSEKKQ